ncbi:hypothetical protein U1Q18_040709, partial [Sarracenia purpurea var. burkii]
MHITPIVKPKFVDHKGILVEKSGSILDGEGTDLETEEVNIVDKEERLDVCATVKTQKVPVASSPSMAGNREAGKEEDLGEDDDESSEEGEEGSVSDNNGVLEASHEAEVGGLLQPPQI